ncbi:MAG: hypothetical protein HUU46_03245 [Candidatus Hydrogenedentes bacterium]|nr:hypothetical protein [Candidatus Hydrogenedentota bacterium]
MPIPIIEGIQLFNAARGLIQEIRGKGQSAPAQTTPKTVQIPESAFAQLLRAQLRSQQAPTVVFAQKAGETDTTTTTTAGPVKTRIEELIAQYESELSELREQLGSAFENNLIDTAQELDLTLGADGSVTVANDHPNKTQIDALFAAHPMLRYGFARLASSASMIETSLDTFPPGLRNFGNPAQSVTDFGSLLAGENAPSQFHLVLGPEGIRTYFGSDTSGETETVAA